MNYIKSFIEFYREKVPKLIRMALAFCDDIVVWVREK